MRFGAVQVKCWIGLSGVAQDENPRARAWGRFFEWPLIMVAIWLPIEWHLEITERMPTDYIAFTDWIVWSFFVLETVVTTAMVNDRLRHLRCNWMNLFIIAVGLPLLWPYTPMAAVLRSLRLLLVVGIIIRFSRTIREILARNKLGYSLVIVAMVIFIAGFIIDALEPQIKSPWEGMWWALVTITTVGYGDVVPTTPEGRAFGAIIIVLGVVVFSLVTANISAYLVGREVTEVEEKVEEVKAQVHQRVGTVEKELKQELREEIVEEELDLRREFQRLNQRLERIERELARRERGGGRGA